MNAAEPETQDVVTLSYFNLISSLISFAIFGIYAMRAYLGEFAYIAVTKEHVNCYR